MYSIIGGIYAEYAKDREQAVFNINKAIKIHQRDDDEMGLAVDYNNMSKISIYIGGEKEEDLEYLEKAEQIYKKYGYMDSFGLAGTFINKGHLYKKNGQYEEALEACIEAQGIYKKRQENNTTLDLLTSQAYLEMQEYELAEEQYFEAQRICEIENNQYKVAVVKFQLGDLYLNKMDYDQAIEVYNQALEFYMSDEAYLSDTAFTYSSLAYTYNHSGNLTNALETSIYACRIIENLKAFNNKTEEDKKRYKHNLSRYYEKWSKDMTEEGFETWYQDIVIECNEWQTGDEQDRDY